MKTILTTLLIALFVSAFAGNDDNKDVAVTNETKTYSIKGKVIDKVTGEALVGVQVVLGDGSVACYTDFDGNFVISNVYSGSYTIAANYISYQNNIIKNVKAGNESEVTVELLPIVAE